MSKKIKIAISIPDSVKHNRYFSFRLKENIQNEISVYNQAKKIFVVSDNEANFRSFCKLLVKWKIINRRLQWIFGENHLVILGDCFDQSEQALECLWLIYSLEEKAKRQNGYVHFILGNCKIMNMSDDWRYIHPKYALNTKSTDPHTALYGGNNELWRWLQTKNIIEKIGEILFVQGRIVFELIKLRLSIKEINEEVRPYYDRVNELFTGPLLALVYNDETSPFGFQSYSKGNISRQQIDEILVYFEAKTIVTGHNIMDQMDNIYDGKIINVSLNQPIINSEALYIRKDKFYRVTMDGKKEQIK